MSTEITNEEENEMAARERAYEQMLEHMQDHPLVELWLILLRAQYAASVLLLSAGVFVQGIQGSLFVAVGGCFLLNAMVGSRHVREAGGVAEYHARKILKENEDVEI